MSHNLLDRRNVILVLTILAIPMLESSSLAQWTPQASDTKARLRGLHVVNDKIIWASGTQGTFVRTTDGGTTWQKILYTDERTGCADVVMNPENPDELFATMWEFRRKPYAFNSGGKGSAMYKSTDGGKTWIKITKGLPEGELGRIALAISPSNPKHLLSIVEAKETNLYASADGGESWSKEASTQNVEARPFYFSTIAFDPKDDKRVYRPSFGLSISDDGGFSFTDASNSSMAPF